MRSMFAGILKCRHCGGTVTRVSKGKHVYLVCSAANSSSRTCQYEAVPYFDVRYEGSSARPHAGRTQPNWRNRSQWPM